MSRAASVCQDDFQPGIRPSKKEHMFLVRISIQKRAGGRFFFVIYYFLLHAFFTQYYLPPGALRSNISNID